MFRFAALLTVILLVAGSAAAQTVNSTSRSNTQHNIVINIPGLAPQPVTARSFSFGTSPRELELASGHPIGRRQWGPLTIVKDVDSASAPLAKLATTGKHLPSVTIQFMDGDKATQVLNLSDVTILSYTKGHIGNSETEQISFGFDKITYENRGGKTAADSWDK